MNNISINNCSCLSTDLYYLNTYHYIISTCINTTYGSFYEYSDKSCTQLSTIYSGGNGMSISNNQSSIQYVLDCNNNRKCQIKNTSSSKKLSISYFILIINLIIYSIINI